MSEPKTQTTQKSGASLSEASIKRTPHIKRRPTKTTEEKLRKALEPFAVIGRAIRENATTNAWLEHPLFYAGTDEDPQSMTLTGKAFNDAAEVLDD